MKKWEHKIVGVSTLNGMTDGETVLDRLGREGWEIVATTSDRDDRAIFKRRKFSAETKSHRELLKKVLPHITPVGGYQTKLACEMQALADEIKQALSE